jgi:hypothetical protein
VPISLDFNGLKSSKIERANRQTTELESVAVTRRRESLIEKGLNPGNARKFEHHKVGIRSSEFELKKSRRTKREILPQRHAGTSVYKVDIITEKLDSKIKIRSHKNSGNVLEERRYSYFSRKSDFLRDLKTSLRSPGRLEFQGHPDRIVCASKFLIKKNRKIFFSHFEQEISRSFDFGNRLD